MDGNRSRIVEKETYLACQLSASFFSRFVVSGGSLTSLLIILEFYSDAARPDIELYQNYGKTRTKFLCGRIKLCAVAQKFCAGIRSYLKLILHRL